MRLSSLLLNVVVGAALMALVLAAVDTAALLATLRTARWEPLALALALVQAQIVLSALRWRHTARRLGQPIALPRALAWYYEASFLNLVLPAGVLGDGFRAWRASAGNGGFAGALRAVVFERLSGQVAFFALALGGLWLWPFMLRTRVPDGVVDGLVAAAVAAAAATSLVAALTLRRRVQRWLAELGEDLARCFVRDGAWAIQGALSVLVVLSYVAVFALAANSVGHVLAPVALFTVAPLVLLTMLIPVSIGGWGVREAAAAALWPILGHSAAEGVAVALVYGLVVLAGSLPGAVFLVIAPRRGSSATDAAAAGDRRA